MSPIGITTATGTTAIGTATGIITTTILASSGVTLFIHLGSGVIPILTTMVQAFTLDRVSIGTTGIAITGTIAITVTIGDTKRL